jgi:hypothetical protein
MNAGPDGRQLPRLGNGALTPLWQTLAAAMKIYPVAAMMGRWIFR